jgi:MinD-like ATPase involved in chromosome partitioning or flagellar assembly
MDGPSAVPAPRPHAVAVAVLSGGAPWEVALLPVLERQGSGLHLVRRCVDVADLLAVGTAGTVRVAVVDADLPRLDADVVARLRGLGVAVLAVAGSDAHASTALALGAADVASSSEPPTDVAARVRALGRPQPSEPAPVPAPVAASVPENGRLLVVWGPGGAPGRSTVAVTLAAELAEAGREVLLVDADAGGGAVSTMLGILDEAPGVAAACRAGLRGRLDAGVLAASAVAVAPRLRVLTGATRPDRWRELHPVALEAVWAVATTLVEDVVVDVGAALDEPDTPTAAPAAATRSAVAVADVLLAVAAADPLGLLRLVHGLDRLADATAAPPQVVVNRLRPSVLGAHPRAQVRQTLQRFSGAEPVAYLPDDPAAVDTALRAGRPLTVAAPSSALRRGVGELARRLTPGIAARPASVRGHRRQPRRGRSLPSAG